MRWIGGLGFVPQPTASPDATVPDNPRVDDADNLRVDDEGAIRIWVE